MSSLAPPLRITMGSPLYSSVSLLTTFACLARTRFPYLLTGLTVTPFYLNVFASIIFYYAPSLYFYLPNKFFFAFLSTCLWSVIHCLSFCDLPTGVKLREAGSIPDSPKVWSAPNSLVPYSVNKLSLFWPPYNIL